MLTPDEFRRKMLSVTDTGDIEASHCAADDLMCDLLTTLGYGDGVEVFRDSQRWYA